MESNIETLNQIKEKIKEYAGKSLSVEFRGAIEHYFLINDAQLLLSEEFLIITDGKRNSLRVEMLYLDSVNITDRCMVLIMENEITIKLDY